MSVLKCKRGISAMEYVNTANQIYLEVFQFLTRLSARYERLIAPDVIRLASETLDYAEKANTIYPNDQVRQELREQYLLKARAAVSALDIHMEHVYELCMLNPQGCFNSSKGKPISSNEACKRLDKMSQSLGEKIDREMELLSGVLKSDKSKSKQ